jgi:hypothetical protein
MSEWKTVHVNPGGFFQYKTDEASGDLVILNAYGNRVFDEKTRNMVKTIAGLNFKRAQSHREAK